MARDYVTVEQLTDLLGLDPETDAARAQTVCDLAAEMIDGYVGAAGVATNIGAGPVWPTTVVEAALVLAADLWRRPGLPGGYTPIVDGDAFARVALDPTRTVGAYLDGLKLSWGVA